ncbi:MFS transporter [Streptomyces sp. NPDC058623]|uniref:MFS transporter n=1 Tax=Streptomyces sp. NPDC058623 TaxID=3346563 RepID=UPI003648188E
MLLVARFLIGISVGGFWSIAGGIALRLVPERHVARATAVIFGGVETASVLGVPTGTFLGDLSGWRTAFGAVGLVALVAMLILMPKIPAERTISFGDLPKVWKGNSGVRIGIAMTFLVITGNFIAGALIAKRLRQVVLGIAVVLAMLLLATVGNTTTTAAVILVLWGLGYGAVPVTFQTWILDAAPHATEAASSLYVSTFNLSIALGAPFGGFAVENLATASVLWIGAGLAVLTLLVVGRRSGRPHGAIAATEPAADQATAAVH